MSTGESVAEVDRALREAIRLHDDGLEEDGLSVDPPSWQDISSVERSRSGSF